METTTTTLGLETVDTSLLALAEASRIINDLALVRHADAEELAFTFGSFANHPLAVSAIRWVMLQILHGHTNANDALIETLRFALEEGEFGQLDHADLWAIRQIARHGKILFS